MGHGQPPRPLARRRRAALPRSRRRDAPSNPRTARRGGALGLGAHGARGHRAIADVAPSSDPSRGRSGAGPARGPMDPLRHRRTGARGVPVGVVRAGADAVCRYPLAAGMPLRGEPNDGTRISTDLNGGRAGSAPLRVEMPETGAPLLAIRDPKIFFFGCGAAIHAPQRSRSVATRVIRSNPRSCRLTRQTGTRTDAYIN